MGTRAPGTLGSVSLDGPATPPPYYRLRRSAVRGVVVAEGYDFDAILEVELRLRAEGVSTFLSTESGRPPTSAQTRTRWASVSAPPESGVAPAPPSALTVEGGAMPPNCVCGVPAGWGRDGGEVFDAAGPVCWVCASDADEEEER